MINFINVSPFYSEDVTQGHFYHVHKKFKETFSKDFNFINVGPIMNCQNDTYPILNIELKSFDLVLSDIELNQEVDNLISNLSKFFYSNSQNVIHVYEGTTALFQIMVELYNRVDNLVIFFNFHWPLNTENHFKELKFDKLLTKLNKKNYRNKMYLFAESKIASKKFESMLKLKVYKYPTFSVLENTNLKKRSAKQIIMIPSHQDEIFLMKKVINYLTYFSNFKFIILKHWNLNLDYSVLKSTKVELKLEYLPTADYCKLLESTRILVLPYEKIIWYKSGSSGRLSDGLNFGVNVIVPSESSLFTDNRNNKLVHRYHNGSAVSLSLKIIYINLISRFLFFDKNKNSQTIETLFNFVATRI